MSNVVPAPPLPKIENVNHPDHYNNCSLECWDVMRIAFTEDELAAFCRINAFKYLWRYKFKNGKEDLEKAKWYLDKIGDDNLTENTRVDNLLEYLYYEGISFEEEVNKDDL